MRRCPNLSSVLKVLHHPHHVRQISLLHNYPLFMISHHVPTCFIVIQICYTSSHFMNFVSFLIGDFFFFFYFFLAFIHFHHFSSFHGFHHVKHSSSLFMDFIMSHMFIIIVPSFSLFSSSFIIISIHDSSHFSLSFSISIFSWCSLFSCFFGLVMILDNRFPSWFIMFAVFS